MKRLTILLTGVMMVGAVALAAAGDFHVGTNLVCSDCHVAHYSQSHGYTVGGIFTPLGAEGPYEDLLRDDPNKLCLACHNGSSFAPDVFGANGGAVGVRQAGGLNVASGHGLSNDAGYDEIDGHTLYSTAMPPGAGTTAYVPGAEGLTCVNCHSQHGSATQYRNLLNRGIFTGDTLSYAVGTNDLTRDVFERGAAEYTIDRIDFNEPSPRQSHYAKWCKACHVDFHGQGGDANMGGQEGGVTSTNTNPWKRHPTADVNIGTPGATFISSLARYAGNVNKVKVMDSQGLWTGTGGNTTVTPSCMSCHKAHGNMNGFGLIFMSGTGTVTEEGDSDGGRYNNLCRQCHVQGA